MKMEQLLHGRTGVNEGDEEAIRNCFMRAIESTIDLTQNQSLTFDGENFRVESFVENREYEEK